jgi:ABC-type glycerol-3-phosphate transport system substrate-binding protein
MSEEKVSRRGYAKYAAAGVVVIAVAGAGAYYASRPTTAPTQTVTEKPQTITATLTEQPVEPTVAEDTGPLMFTQWAFAPEVVTENIEIFQNQYNENVRQEVLIGADYGALVETKFISKAPLDVCYAFAFHAHRWYNANWIRNLSDFENLAEMKKDLYPISEFAMTSPVDNQLIALPYCCFMHGTMMANELVLEKAGLTGEYPKNMAELIEQCETIKQKGIVDTPYEPYWTSEEYGLWPFLGECHGRGDDLFDPNTLEPTFDTNTGAGDVLRDWRYMYDKELIPRGTLTATEGDHIAWFATGQYAYGQQSNYDNKRFNDPAQSQIAGHCSFVPFAEEFTAELNNCMYVIAERPRHPNRLDRVKNMFKWFGYKDHNGQYFVQKKWLIDYGITAGVKGLFEEPDVRSAFNEWVYRADDIKTIEDNLENAHFPLVWKSPWYLEWQRTMNIELRKCIRSETTIEECLDAMRDRAYYLIETYE